MNHVFDLDRRFKEILQWNETPNNLEFLENCLVLVKDVVKFCQLDPPYLYLSNEDGLMLEWDYNKWSISVEFDKGVVYGDVVNIDTHDTDDFELFHPFDTSVLLSNIKNMLEKTGWWEGRLWATLPSTKIVLEIESFSNLLNILESEPNPTNDLRDLMKG